MRGLLAFIGTRFGWDKSRKFHLHRSDLQVFQKGINLLGRDKVGTQSSLCECFDCTSPGSSAMLLARMTRTPSVRSIKLKGQSRQQWCLRTFLGRERRFFHPTLQVIFRTYEMICLITARPLFLRNDGTSLRTSEEPLSSKP